MNIRNYLYSGRAAGHDSDILGGLVIAFAAIVLQIGYLKTAELNLAIGVDITLLSLVATLVCSMLYVFRARSLFFRLPTEMLWIYACTIPALFWYEPSGYIDQKIARMYLVTLPIALIPYIVLLKRERHLVLLLVTHLVSLVVSVNSAFYHYENLGTIGRLSTYGSSTNGLGLSSAVGVLIGSLLLMHRSKIIKIYVLLALPVQIWSLFGSGSRAELLGLLLALLIAVAKFVRRVKSIMTFCIILGVGVFVFQEFKDYIPELSLSRLQDSFIYKSDKLGTLRESDRLNLWGAAASVIPTRPLGIGWGRYEEVYLGYLSEDVNRAFPHNIILEAMLEGGWACGVVLLVVIVRTLSFAYRRMKISDEISIAVVLVPILLFVVACFSGEWNDCRMLFFFISTAACYFRMDRTVPEKTRFIQGKVRRGGRVLVR